MLYLQGLRVASIICRSLCLLAVCFHMSVRCKKRTTIQLIDGGRINSFECNLLLIVMIVSKIEPSVHVSIQVDHFCIDLERALAGSWRLDLDFRLLTHGGPSEKVGVTNGHHRLTILIGMHAQHLNNVTFDSSVVLSVAKMITGNLVKTHEIDQIPVLLYSDFGLLFIHAIYYSNTTD